MLGSPQEPRYGSMNAPQCHRVYASVKLSSLPRALRPSLTVCSHEPALLSLMLPLMGHLILAQHDNRCNKGCTQR